MDTFDFIGGPVSIRDDAREFHSTLLEWELLADGHKMTVLCNDPKCAFFRVGFGYVFTIERRLGFTWGVITLKDQPEVLEPGYPVILRFIGKEVKHTR